jgi:4-hydroxyphenylpyruvate dioxygenase-like putative hemolysin
MAQREKQDSRGDAGAVPSSAGKIGTVNPIGTDGFEFVEYAAPDPQLLRTLFARLVFPVTAQHRSKT